jgi:hypothetical protein
MGIFDSIKNAIWGEEKAETPKTAAPQRPVVTASATGSAAAPVPPSSSSAPASAPTASAPQAAPKPAAAAPQAAAPAASQAVDVTAILDAAVKRKGQKLEWRRSIVDLMKALDLDSSLASRKKLAEELHYDGDMDKSAEMNMWLHKAVMKKLAENGGRVPADLAD